VIVEACNHFGKLTTAHILEGLEDGIRTTSLIEVQYFIFYLALSLFKFEFFCLNSKLLDLFLIQLIHPRMESLNQSY